VIFALLFAAQAAQPAVYTPQEERAVMATMVCLKRHVDAVPRPARRKRGEALIEEAFAACAGEEAALRALLRRRFNERSTERAVAIVRDTSRNGMRRYIRR
jgi:hypothetical protein